MTTPNQNITTEQGESERIVVPITQDGNPKDLTGADVVWAVYLKASSDTAVLTKTVGDGITIVNVDSTNDGIRIEIDVADTEELAARSYYHECRVQDSESKQKVVFTGCFIVNPSPTAGSIE